MQLKWIRTSWSLSIGKFQQTPTKVHVLAIGGLLYTWINLAAICHEACKVWVLYIISTMTYQTVSFILHFPITSYLILFFLVHDTCILLWAWNEQVYSMLPWAWNEQVYSMLLRAWNEQVYSIPGHNNTYFSCKVDFGCNILWHYVIGITICSNRYITIGHLGVWIFRPFSDKIIQRLRNGLEQRYKCTLNKLVS